MMTIPFGEDPINAIASYFKTDDGVEVLESLESLLD
jgi:hypothetical protein